MNRLRWNIASNFASRGWAALISVAFVPVYIRFVGIEAYGLIGFYTSLDALFNLLDFGFSTIVNREMTRYSLHPELVDEARNLLRTVEVCYWSIGLVLAAALSAFASPIARHWVMARELSPATIEHAVIAMGVMTAFHWPLSVYEGGLIGLQRQVLTNAIRAGTATARGFGAILILWLASPTIAAFFAWLIVVSTLQTALTAYCLWRNLPGSGHRPRFQRGLLVNLRQFATGMSGIAIVGALVAQSDKLVLSTLLPLDTFGYYSLAAVLAGGLTLLAAPMLEAMFPAFSRLVSVGDRSELAALYHKSCQLLAVLVLPIGSVLVLFARQILLLWTGNAVTAANTFQIAGMLTAATTLNALVYLPYGLQIAHGWTRMLFAMNLAGLVFFLPAVIILAVYDGAVGAAGAAVLLNAGFVLIGVRLMNGRVWPDQPWRWHLEDVGYPMLAALSVAGLGRWIVDDDWPALWLIIGIAATTITSAVSAALAARDLRAVLVTTGKQWLSPAVDAS